MHAGRDLDIKIARHLLKSLVYTAKGWMVVRDGVETEVPTFSTSKAWRQLIAEMKAKGWCLRDGRDEDGGFTAAFVLCDSRSPPSRYYVAETKAHAVSLAAWAVLQPKRL